MAINYFESGIKLYDKTNKGPWVGYRGFPAQRGKIFFFNFQVGRFDLQWTCLITDWQKQHNYLQTSNKKKYLEEFPEDKLFSTWGAWCNMHLLWGSLTWKRLETSVSSDFLKPFWQKALKAKFSQNLSRPRGLPWTHDTVNSLASTQSAQHQSIHWHQSRSGHSNDLTCATNGMDMCEAHRVRGRPPGYQVGISNTSPSSLCAVASITLQL